MMVNKGLRSRSRLLAVVAATVVAGAVALSGIASAAGPRAGAVGGAWGVAPGAGTYGPLAAQQALGLSDEQVQQMGQIRNEVSQQVLPLQQQLAQKQLELRSLMLQAKPDAAAVKALTQEIARLQGEIRALGVDGQLRIRALLTDEQVAKLNALGGFGAGPCGGGFGPMGRGFHGGRGGMMGGPRAGFGVGW